MVDAYTADRGEAGLVGAPTPRVSGLAQGFGGGRAGRLEGADLGLDLVVAVADLGLSRRLAEHEQLLGAVVAREGGGDLLPGGLTAGVAVAGQYRGVGLARDDVAQDGEPGHPGDIGDVVELEIPSTSGALDRAAADATADRGAGSGCAAPRSVASGRKLPRSKPLLDLAVQDVALAAGHAFHVAGVDEQDLDPTWPRGVVEGDPVDPRRLHGDRVLGGQRLEIVRDSRTRAWRRRSSGTDTQWLRRR